MRSTRYLDDGTSDVSYFGVVGDAAVMLHTIAGYDQLDPPAANVPVPDYTRAFNTGTSNLRLGVPRSPFFENLDPEVARAVETAIAVPREISNRVTEPPLPPTFPLLTPIIASEAYAYHAKSIAESPDRYQRVTRDRIIQFAAGAGVTGLRSRNRSTV